MTTIHIHNANKVINRGIMELRRDNDELFYFRDIIVHSDDGSINTISIISDKKDALCFS